MKHLLQEDFEAFLKTYEREQSYGLRLNPLKVDPKQFLEESPFTLEKVPWTKHGYYYNGKERPGKHPYHDAGLYYIQEPSAMAVVEIMAPKPGEKILDLAAAPGGKATQIAVAMDGKGLLVANEIHPRRARILSENIERMGIRNTVVINERPERLATKFPSFFDRILLDAPCSGEGMFRKNEEAIDEWSLENVNFCSTRQLQIIEEAKKMLKPGGQLVYSTCTFSPEENEELIQQFLKKNSEFIIEKVQRYEGFQKGRKDWVDEPMQDLEHTVRIWPHHSKGEGHFIAVLRKRGGKELDTYRPFRTLKNEGSLQRYRTFVKETLQTNIKGSFYLWKDELYLVPEEMIDWKELKVIRPGLHLGTNKRNRFEPSHALALTLSKEEVLYTWDLPANSEEVRSYLRGETIPAKGSDGWYLITVDGYSLGWGKLVAGTMKNHYPKGLRWLGIS